MRTAELTERGWLGLVSQSFAVNREGVNSADGIFPGTYIIIRRCSKADTANLSAGEGGAANPRIHDCRRPIFVGKVRPTNKLGGGRSHWRQRVKYNFCGPPQLEKVKPKQYGFQPVRYPRAWIFAWTGSRLTSRSLWASS